MDAEMEIVKKYSINFKDCALVINVLYHISHRQRSGIVGVLEISGIDSVLPDFIEHTPRTRPFVKSRSVVRGFGARDIFVLVVLFSSLNNAVVCYILDRL